MQEFPTRRHQWPQGDRPVALVVGRGPGVVTLSVPRAPGHWVDLDMPVDQDPRREALRVELAKAGVFPEARGW